MKIIDKCEICKFWQNFEERVYAMVNEETGHYRGKVELRRCQWNPHPSTAHEGSIYVPAGYSCDEFREKVK